MDKSVGEIPIKVPMPFLCALTTPSSMALSSSWGGTAFFNHFRVVSVVLCPKGRGYAAYLRILFRKAPIVYAYFRNGRRYFLNEEICPASAASAFYAVADSVMPGF